MEVLEIISKRSLESYKNLKRHWISKVIVLFFVFSPLFFNANAQNLENKIYNSIDVLVASPNLENLNKLELIEKKFKPKSKEEFLTLVILNTNKAYFQNQFDQQQNAISSYELAWKTFEKNNLSNYDIIENCLVPLANLYIQMGDFINAENTIKQYYHLAFIAKRIELTHTAILNLAIVQQQSGNINLSIELLEGMLNSNQLNQQEKALYKSNLGANYLLLNQNDKSEKEIREAIKIFEKPKNQNLKLSNCYKNLSSIYFQKKDYKLAINYFETAMQYSGNTVKLEPQNQAKNYYDFAELLYKTNTIGKAKEYLNLALNDLIDGFQTQKDSLPTQEQLYADVVLLDVLDLKAEIYVQENKPKKALETYKLCNYIEDLFNNLLVYENSKIINQIKVHNRVEKCIEIYQNLFQIEKKQRYLEMAFLLVEKAKSGILKDYLSKNKSISKEEKLLQNQLQNINNKIIKEQQKLNNANLDTIHELINSQNQTMLLLKSKQKTNPNSTDKFIDLKMLFAKLSSKKASLIEYFVGQNKIYSFTLIDNKISLNTIENSEINKTKITNFIDFFANPDAISNNILGFNSTGNALYQTLSLSNKLTSKNLIIIPDGLLNFVPFEALITKKSSSTNFAKMNYLLRDFIISYNNSASFYLNGKSISNSKKTVLGIFPIFEKTDFELSFSKTEMQSIKSNFNGNYFENSTATFANFKKNANNFSILHLSTHADAGNTETPASMKFFDQDILYSELYRLSIKPDLVVLSACQTGIGKLYKSEGAMSIARGFQFAGAENLLFSLWKVNDYTTSIFMANFYKNIKENKSFSEANHQAKLDFLDNKEISNSKKSPYYWSAFVYYGSIEKEVNSNLWMYILGFIATLFLFIFVRYRKRNNAKSIQ
jgi:CHAT domain-containing protein/tetratricopeptide (TPR) repeat protein